MIDFKIDNPRGKRKRLLGTYNHTCIINCKGDRKIENIYKRRCIIIIQIKSNQVCITHIFSLLTCSFSSVIIKGNFSVREEKRRQERNFHFHLFIYEAREEHLPIAVATYMRQF